MRNTKKVIAATAAVATLVGLAACGSSNDNGANKGDADKAELVFWGWDSGNSMKEILADFEKANPGITVKFNNTGTAEKTSTALSNAIAAGNGAPDVVMLEDPTVTQFAVTDGLVDLSEFGADKLADDFAAGPWNKLQYNNKPYALPIDSGPEMFFYNKAVFDKAGVDGESIKTWNDYYEAAKKLKKIGVYITADSGDASFYDTMIWLAGGRPFSTSNDGKNVTIRLIEDKGTREFTEFWQKMIDEGLVATNLTSWSDRWKSAVGQGKVASLFSGAWLPSLLMSDIPGAAGLWRVAQMPTPDGKATTSENGGSALAVLQRSRKPEASYRFIEYACHNAKGITTRVDGGAFPADKNTLSDSKFLSKTTVTDDRGIEVPYFGGQEYNRVLSQAAENVSTGYQYLPFEVYARSDFRSTVGKAYKWSSLLRKEQNRLNIIAAGGQVSDTSNIGDALKNTESSDRIKLKGGIALWQKDLKEYGANQGFTIQ